MRKTLFVFCFIFLTVCALAQTQQRPLRRAESFFGFHFDFHASPEERDIGKTLTEGMVDSLLSMAKPDYIQVDCKGHPGISSYPTKVGNQAASYTQDILKLFRRVTDRHGVALYVHYSGVWDQEAIVKHPSWGIVRADGTRDKLKNSFLSGYLDSLFIPQMKELSDVYHVDGAWIDGDCWAAEPDYSPELVKEFALQTGIAVAPKSNDDPNYKSFLEFTRTIFKRHAKKYIDAVHEHNPKFQITSNWAYSSLMPEKVEMNVDYLSGDVAGQNCVNNAAFQARCLALQGKPWDLMAWSFGYAGKDVFFIPKSLRHLEQEAAEVMAMGGGFQSYWTQNRDGSLKTWNYPEMSELAKFCRARQPFCQGSEAVPQIALWYSVNSWKQSFGGVYAGGTGPMEGVLTLLLDGQHTVDVLMDHQLASRLAQYRLLVIPEWTNLDQSLKGVVLDYVSNGGSLLVVGASAVKEFEPQLGATFAGELKNIPFYIGYPHDLTGLKSRWQPVTSTNAAVSVGACYSVCDSRYPTGNPVATIAAFGKGKIAGLYCDIGESYYSAQSPVFRKLMNDLVDRLDPLPVLKIRGSHLIHTVLSRKGSQQIIHLINTGGSHFNSKVFTYDEVPPIGPITVQLRTASKPESVVLQPEGRPLLYEWRSGILNVTVPWLEIHSMVEVGQ